jgi:hypothetical protein
VTGFGKQSPRARSAQLEINNVSSPKYFAACGYCDKEATYNPEVARVTVSTVLGIRIRIATQHLQNTYLDIAFAHSCTHRRLKQDEPRELHLKANNPTNTLITKRCFLCLSSSSSWHEASLTFHAFEGVNRDRVMFIQLDMRKQRQQDLMSYIPCHNRMLLIHRNQCLPNLSSIKGTCISDPQ